MWEFVLLGREDYCQGRGVCDFFTSRESRSILVTPSDGLFMTIYTKLTLSLEPDLLRASKIVETWNIFWDKNNIER